MTTLKKIDKKINEIVDNDFKDNIVQHSDNKIVILEKDYNIKLPADYKYFILNYGELVIKENFYFKPLEQTPKSPKDGYHSINIFYGLNDNDMDIRKKINQYKYEFKNKYVPIALLPGENQLCLDVNGQVYFWDHESLTDKSIYLVSKSFSKFIFDLQKYKKKISVKSGRAKIRLNDNLLK